MTDNTSILIDATYEALKARGLKPLEVDQATWAAEVDRQRQLRDGPRFCVSCDGTTETRDGRCIFCDGDTTEALR